MRNVLVLASRELGFYLVSPVAYVAIGVFLIFSGGFFSAYLAVINYADTSLSGFVEIARLLILVFAALLTMRLVTEERRTGTWELLLTAPIRDVEIVLGKYLAAAAVMALMLALTLYFPFLLYVFGDPDIGPIVTSYIGLVLLGSAALAIGVFGSSVSSNQIVAALISGGILFGLWLVGFVAGFVPDPLAEVVRYVSLSAHFPDFMRGILDTRALVYYVSVSAIFLYLATVVIELERWR